MEPRTVRAIRECAAWLHYCLKIGWKKSDLDFLESLWWKYRNHRGELVRSR